MTKRRLSKLIKEQKRERNYRYFRSQIINPLKRIPRKEFTLRQRAIAALKMTGFTHREIAQLLTITIDSSKSTLWKIKRKLGIEKDFRVYPF